MFLIYRVLSDFKKVNVPMETLAVNTNRKATKEKLQLTKHEK